MNVQKTKENGKLLYFKYMKQTFIRTCEGQLQIFVLTIHLLVNIKLRTKPWMHS